MDEQRDEHHSIYNNLNEEQRNAFNAVMDSVDNNLGKLIFVEGYGGTCKTFMWKAITTKLRSKGKIVLAVASGGIAALLLDGRRTSHCNTPNNNNNKFGGVTMLQDNKETKAIDI
jgi:hypothetical protein